MEDMIAKIIEMDKKAREMNDEAQRRKLNYEQHIIRKKESIKNDYLERAKKRIAINQQTAQKKADSTLQMIRERDEAIIRELEQSYEKNCDTWVDTIVSHVTDG